MEELSADEVRKLGRGGGGTLKGLLGNSLALRMGTILR